jgi:hypothetical protein
MDGLRVLITTHNLDTIGGGALYVRDLAVGLRSRGHIPIVYAINLGEAARLIRDQTIPVVDNLEAVATSPDVIHGHCHIETMTALLHFQGVPAVFTCHGWYLWLDAPPRFPRLLKYIAVDDTARDRLIFEHGIPEERVRMLYSFVDLERFAERTALPAQPSRALLISSHPNERHFLGELNGACRASGVELDIIGPGSRRVSTHIETVIKQYDIVFAKGRAAMESLAVGAAVVPYTLGRVGAMVTAGDLAHLMPLNFGVRAMGEQLKPGAVASRILAELSKYNAEDAARASKQIRSIVDYNLVIDANVELYREVIKEYGENKQTIDHGDEGRAAAAYLRQLDHDLEVHGAATLRLKKRLAGVPGLGRFVPKLARFVKNRGRLTDI